MRVLGALLLLLVPASAPSVVAKIRTDLHPCGAAAGLGAVWVAGYESGRLLRLNTETNRVAQRIKVASGICPVAVAGRFVWVASDKTDVVYRVDPMRGRVVSRLRTSHWPAHLAVAAGSLWVSSYEHGHVVQVSLKTNRMTRLYDLNGNPSGLAGTPGALWVSFGRTGRSLARIDLATRQISRVPIGHAQAGFLVSLGGSLWTTTGDGYAVRIDPRTRRVVASFRVRGTPAGIAAAPDGLIWVAEKEHDTITRIDPVSNKVVDVTPAGDGALSIVRAGGDMWITNFAGTDVWRFDAG